MYSKQSLCSFSANKPVETSKAYAPSSSTLKNSWYLKKYDPIKAGTIDGQGSFVSDKALLKAMDANYTPDTGEKITNKASHTLFVGRLNPLTVEETLRTAFSVYGQILKVRIVRNIVTGASMRYGFVEFSELSSCIEAYRNSGKMTINEQLVLVDYERSRLMEKWKPRRLGGGFSGCKESGQLRFGAKDRPFKVPFRTKDGQKPEIPRNQLRGDCWNFYLAKREISAEEKSNIEKSSKKLNSTSGRYHSTPPYNKKYSRDKGYYDRSERDVRNRHSHSSYGDYHSSGKPYR